MTKIDHASRGFLGEAPAPDRYGHSFDQNGASGLICQMVPLKSRVLDVGCGDGSLAEILQMRCSADIFGIEPDAARAAMARAHGIQVLTGFLDENLAKTIGLFDILLFADVLEHVPDPFALIQNALACLKPGGSLIVSVPNIAHWSVRTMICFGRFDYEPFGIMDATHLRWFTKRSIVAFLNRAGLEAIDVRSSSGTSLSAYRRWPWAWMPKALVWHLAVWLSRLWPTMFGCQTIVRAARVRDRA